MIEKYTIRRKTNRWTFNVFMYMLDVAAYNAYVLSKIKSNSSPDEHRERPKSLFVLGQALVWHQMVRRSSFLAEKSFSGVQTSIRESFIRCGINLKLRSSKKQEYKALSSI